MFEINDGVIKITKGDTASIRVALKNADGSERAMSTGDTLTLTVRQRPGTDVLLQVTSTTSTLYLTASGTKNLVAGSCCYDIEYKTAGGSVFTIVGPTDKPGGNMIVYPEITE